MLRVFSSLGPDPFFFKSQFLHDLCLCSAGASFSNYDEDETYASDEEGEANDHKKSTTAEDTTAYFNYQTYMDKTPSTRWSKQDTELFYEVHPFHWYPTERYTSKYGDN